MDEVLHKFTSYLKRAISEALAFASAMNQEETTIAYLLHGLIQQKGSLASEILNKLGLTAENYKSYLIKDRVKNNFDFDQDKKKKQPDLSKQAKACLEKAVAVAHKHQHKYVGTEHLLMAIVNLDSLEVKKILQDNNIKLLDLKKHLDNVLRSTSKFPDLTNLFDKIKKEGDEELAGPAFGPAPALGRKPGNPLEIYCTNLTNPAIQKSIDPVIGRQTEIDRLINILSRRTKNNPALLGDAGVGKTAIVEGLAKRILTGEVPEVLAQKKIYNLDLSLVVAGTIYRGEFESRIKQIIDKVKSDRNIIIFIDELHTIIGTGSTQGSMDAANILKPALAKGQVRIIGATTQEEYKKHIESDSALERRFQPIQVRELSQEETEEVLKGIRKNYEKYHRVEITDQAIEAAVSLSSRYLQDKFLPDKAIDLIDEAASRIKVKNKKDGFAKEIYQLKNELEKLRKQKSQAVSRENFPRAVAAKSQEKLVLAKIGRIKEKQNLDRLQKLGKINRQDIAEVISGITKIPLTELVSGEKEKLLNIEKRLEKRIIGQKEAIKAVASSIRRSRAGIAEPNRPDGSFIFLGPSGVGKTELAKVLAEVVFEDPDALIRIDMSEFSEKFNISKLIGSPAGYIGYKESNKFTDLVKRKPYAVVLFDEIEKAHPEVFNLLLQVLEDGHLTDAVGKKVDFKNTIIIMTSNVGLSSLNQGAVGFAEAKEGSQEETKNNFAKIKEKVLAELKKQFKPEFLNRIDKTIVFKPLTKAEINKIVKLQLKELANRLKGQDLKIKPEASAVKLIGKKGFSPDQGARAVRKVIQEEIEDVLAEGIISGKFIPGDIIKVKAEKNKMVLTK